MYIYDGLVTLHFHNFDFEYRLIYKSVLRLIFCCYITATTINTAAATD
jgi:hypothetical protein